MKIAKLLVLMVTVSTICSGCVSTAIREGMGAGFGASGINKQLKSPGSLDGYKNFEAGTFTCDMVKQTPKGLLELLPTSIVTHLKEKNIPTGATGKTLVISGSVIHYDVADSKVSKVFGLFEEAVVRITLTDKATKKVIGISNCVGRSNANTNKGLEEKAKGVAKAIEAWIKDNSSASRFKK